MARRNVKCCEIEANSEISDFSDSEMDSEEDEVEVHGSESESDYSETETVGEVAKNGLVWKSVPFAKNEQYIGRKSSKNIIIMKPGVTYYATSHVNSLLSSFLLYMSPTIQKIIIENTNNYGQENVQDWCNIDKDSLLAYIGLLILSGVFKSKNENLLSLYDVENGRPIFAATMPYKRFKQITQALRFDDKSTRRSRRLSDKFSPIRDLWEKWSDVLPKCWNPYVNVTIDEQLVAFRGKCPFRQYMPSKPAKYGIKFWVNVCAESSYVWRIQPYLGKHESSVPERNQGSRVVIDLISGLKGHNVTVDNFFTSYELGQMLLQRKLTMVGTIRKNKSSIPPKLLNVKLPVFTSTFAYTKDTTLVSYIGRKNKCTILQSTLHSNGRILDGENHLPEIIHFYNCTKGMSMYNLIFCFLHYM